MDPVDILKDIQHRLTAIETMLNRRFKTTEGRVRAASLEALHEEIIDFVRGYWTAHRLPVASRILAQRFGRKCKAFGGYNTVLNSLDGQIFNINTLTGGRLHMSAVDAQTLSLDAIHKFEEIGLTNKQLEERRRAMASVRMDSGITPDQLEKELLDGLAKA